MNGAPCAAAVVADAPLAAERREQLATRVFALSAEALKAPLDAYDPVLADLWEDEYEAAVLAALLPDYLMSADGGYIGCLGFVSADYAEEARHAAQRTLLPGSEGGGFGQNDLAVLAIAAWRKVERSGRCLDANLAILAAVASQAFHVTNRRPGPALEKFLHQVRGVFAPMDALRAPGPDAGALAEHFTRTIYDTTS